MQTGSQLCKRSCISLKGTRNNARLVVQGYDQEEGIDYDETFAPVARMEAIRIMIAFTSHMDFTQFQMDVKSAFLNGYMKEEVYVKQPPGFEYHGHPDHVFKLDKALYGLKQAPGSWKHTSGMAHFLGSFLILWGTKKHNSVALLTTEAEYIATASCYCVPLLCDNTSALNMAKVEFNIRGPSTLMYVTTSSKTMFTKSSLLPTMAEDQMISSTIESSPVETPAPDSASHTIDNQNPRTESPPHFISSPIHLISCSHKSPKYQTLAGGVAQSSSLTSPEKKKGSNRKYASIANEGVFVGGSEDGLKTHGEASGPVGEDSELVPAEPSA
ncbi:PREDICTED: uncharacterized protein LOC109226080 [Nicotiana attenuata]|uniref:uncharacterized protein LOC109226080 n=1 Tax=Nicotiana attenuata TaxID=49451 RepID=UPI000905413C|nr:PREDICTED: uncharacterized protein LOC109226080 [Nicotiana attenuata]